MRKRLKKKNMGEFAIYGVSLRFTLVPGLKGDAYDRIIDGFIEEPIESQRLQFGGGGSENWIGVVEPSLPERSIPIASVTRIRDWLAKAPEVLEFEISDPWDVCHGSNPFDQNEPNKTLNPTPDPLVG